ncbi:hypothetical protein C8Q75DRAFT_207288 [Abortiporus biennis]|nr:hypothetical protein C8Q75DRAFT_207288 [Abortiporus biennis]
MDYRPRYSQPFTLAQAISLDVGTITEEISRLQNSIAHLNTTQDQLHEAIEASPDDEFTKALRENEIVIASQTERISILKMALAEKGIPSSEHYDLSIPPHRNPVAAATPAAPPPTAPIDEDGGIDL